MSANSVLSETHPEGAGHLVDSRPVRPWPGLLVVVLWVVVAMTIAAVVLRRRDA